MKFKTGIEYEQYNSGKLHLVISNLLDFLDSVLQLYNIGKNADEKVGLMVTSLHRPDSVKSYHSKWQAADIRTRDWNARLVSIVMTALIVARTIDSRIQHEFEYDPPHLHIEYDDGSINKQE